MPPPRRPPLRELARRLPFAVDDYQAAADAFGAWRASGDPDSYRTSLLWAYCYVTRYFAARFARERATFASDHDAAVGAAIDRLSKSFGDIRDPTRFPHYVSVLCRRVLLTHRSRYRGAVEIRDDDLWTSEPSLVPHDRALVRAGVREAIGRLAPSIQEVARLRLLEGRSYQDIADALGRPIDSVRTYQSKAVRGLRADPGLRSLWSDALGAPELEARPAELVG